MEQDGDTAITEDQLAKRRVPGVIAYLNPFRIVETDDLPSWTATIEQINQRGWDYVALQEIVGGIDVGLPQPYHMVVARDGALVLPRIDGLRSDQEIVEFFNRCLAALLIGGVYCEAITPDGLDLGSIIDWKYVRSHHSGLAAPNQLHLHIRHKAAPALEAIALYEPRTAEFNTLSTAMAEGLQVLGRVPSLSGEYLLKGSTGVARRDWGSGLSNLWVVIEQTLSELWQREIVAPTRAVDQSKVRRDQLNDTRTWTASARIETLYQKHVIESEAVALLSKARKARNELSHSGTHPTEDDALAAYQGACELLSVALSGRRVPLFDLDLTDHMLSDPFSPRTHSSIEPRFWMEIPKLPGEEDLEKAEANWRRERRKRNVASEFDTEN